MTFQNREKWQLVFLVSIAVLVGYIPAILSSLYHRDGEPLVIVILTVVILTATLSLPSIISSFFSDFTFKFILIINLLYAFYKILKPFLIGFFAYLPGAATLMIVASVFSLLASVFLNCRRFVEAGRVFLFAIFFWIGSIPLIAWFQSDSVIYTTLSVDRVINRNDMPVVILLLDEMSPEVMPQLMSVLRESSGQLLHVGVIEKAGKDTINAIPSMLRPQRHDDVSVCGATQLCGVNHFDMSKLQAVHDGTDVVGFYHPYCSIKNLRTCSHASVTEFDYPNGVYDFLYRIIIKLPFFDKYIGLERADEINRLRYKFIRETVARRTFEAPFWDNGGLLFVHQLLPHPDGGVGALRSLADEYSINISFAGDFLDEINKRLRREFINNYVLIITSDHPLRTKKWCSDSIYYTTECITQNPMDGDLVPFMVLAPKDIDVNIPKTNIGLFSQFRFVKE